MSGWPPSSRIRAKRRPIVTSIVNELRLAELAEPLGFESVWGVEHHFTDYTMCPDVLQFLTYMAGRTRTVQLGSMVVVLPWHDPMRVAEEVSMLDNLSGGRLILGMGRGAGEGGVRRLPPLDGRIRARASSSARRCCCAASSKATASTTAPTSSSRGPRSGPRPFKSFRGRTYAAAVSPESVRIMAELGVGILIIPQKPWEEVARELEAVPRGLPPGERGGRAPADRRRAGPSATRAGPAREEMARRYIGGYYQTVLDHYELQGDHLAQTKGYEYYGKMAEKIHQYGTDTVIDFFMNLQVWGTPEQCYEKILDIHARTGQQPLRGRVRLRGHAVRRGGAQPAPVRARGDAAAPEARRHRGGPTQPRASHREARRRPPRLLTSTDDLVRARHD